MKSAWQYSHLQSSNAFPPKALEQVLVQAQVAIRMADPMEASSLYFLFNFFFLSLKCSGCYFYPSCASVPHGGGIGTGAGTGAGTLPGAKPLKPPGMCLYARRCAFKA